MSNIDTLDFMDVWKRLGHISGYVSGLKTRASTLDIEEKDLEYLERLVEDLQTQLKIALKYDE